MQYTNNFIASFVLCAVSLSLCAAPVKELQESFGRVLKEIEAQRLSVLSYDPLNIPEDLPITEQVAIGLEQQRKPQRYMQQKMAYDLLQSFYREHPLFLPHIIDPTVSHDLTIPVGNKLDAPCLADVLYPTHLKVGHAMRTGIILTPTTHIPVLQERQALIKKIISMLNNGDGAWIDEQLAIIAQHEDLLVSCLQDDDFFARLSGEHASNIGVEDADALFNRSPLAVEFLNGARHFERGAKTTCIALMPAILSWYLYCFLNDKPVDERIKNIAGTAGSVALVDYFYAGVFNIVINPSEKTKKGMETGRVFGNGITNLVNFNQHLKLFKLHWAIDRYLYAKTYDIAACFAAAEEIAHHINNDPVLKKSLKLSPHLIALFDDAQRNAMSDDWNQLRDLLSEPTFTEEKSKWVYSRGRVYVAYTLTRSLKDEIAQMMAAVAEFDAYCSMAHLYMAFEQKRVGYCFTSFEKSDAPHVDLHDFWHPLVDPEVAVPNSFTLGDKGVRNCVLTGPNEGGKSTVIKAVSINIILSQTFGMASARRASLTPFAVIATHVHMKDDIGAGNSLFKAEAMRAHTLLEKAKNLRPGQFCFLAIDEIFRSTAPQEASAAAYSVVKKLGECPNTMCIMATHFALPTRLATDTNCFVNYQVPIERETDGSVRRPYPYLLCPGVYTDCVAIEVLRAQGFESDVLSDAYKILATIQEKQAT